MNALGAHNLYPQNARVMQLQNLYQDLVQSQQQDHYNQLFLQNLSAEPIVHAEAEVHQAEMNPLESKIKGVVDASLISVDIKNLGACSYATDSAFYNVGGIIDGDEKNTNQKDTRTTSDASPVIYTFNFCEAPLPTDQIPAGCPTDQDFYAFA